MDTENAPVARRPWWEVRTPALIYGVAALDLVLAGLAFARPSDDLALKILGGLGWVLLAAAFIAAATVTVVNRRRHPWPTERPPLAQESDPTRR